MKLHAMGVCVCVCVSSLLSFMHSLPQSCFVKSESKSRLIHWFFLRQFDWLKVTAGYLDDDYACMVRIKFDEVYVSLGIFLGSGNEKRVSWRVFAPGNSEMDKWQMVFVCFYSFNGTQARRHCCLAATSCSDIFRSSWSWNPLLQPRILPQQRFRPSWNVEISQVKKLCWFHPFACWFHKYSANHELQHDQLKQWNSNAGEDAGWKTEKHTLHIATQYGCCDLCRSTWSRQTTGCGVALLQIEGRFTPVLICMDYWTQSGRNVLKCLYISTSTYLRVSNM